MTLENLHRYDDIIDLPHHRSTKHRHMSNLERVRRVEGARRARERGVQHALHPHCIGR